MELSRLAAKSKRIKTWHEMLEQEVQDPKLAERFRNSLKAFQELMTRAWENGSVTADEEHKILDLERELEQLDEEARLRVRRTTNGVPTKRS